jgi:Xaa-Pro aminopeptidase
MTKPEYNDRRAALARSMAGHGVDLWLQPVTDEFQGEYTAAYAARLTFLTGFTGSAGLGIFPRDPHEHTVLMVDGRYTLQAGQETNPLTTTIIHSGKVTFYDWIRQFQRPITVGFDPLLHSITQISEWQKACADTPITFHPIRPNLVDDIWHDQPAPPAAPIHLHPLHLSGLAAKEKIARIAAATGEYGADALLITQPDAIAWLLNLRGGDIPYNPLFLAYALLTRDGAVTLFTHERSFTQDVLRYVQELGVTIRAIRGIFSGDTQVFSGMRALLVDPSRTPYFIALLAEKSGVTLIKKPDPTSLPKACKNDTELSGMRLAHLRDGLAVTRFLYWLSLQETCDELTVVATLEEFRRHAPTYRGSSFATIAGSGANGAIVHYRATEATKRTVQPGELLLLDSGGHYEDGTTDITRTVAIGRPAEPMRRHFTLVLKGHIALATARFPEGTTGSQLDVLARQYLWAAGLDYDHGTGHGVGAYLCVHEGPQNISNRPSAVALKPGMVLSNEPGYYAAGAYGIRIESLVAVVEITPESSESGGAKKLFGFETLTLAPIDRQLMMVELLRPDERVWLNAYHARVYHAHQGFLSEDERAWLRAATAPV